MISHRSPRTGGGHLYTRGACSIAALVAMLRATCTTLNTFIGVCPALFPRASHQRCCRRTSFTLQGARRISDHTVVQLKQKLRELKLPVSGKKADLVARLEAHEKAANGDAPEDLDKDRQEFPGEAQTDEQAPLTEDKMMGDVFEAMSFTDLRDECRDQGLPTAGTKAQLIDRLRHGQGQSQGPIAITKFGPGDVIDAYYPEDETSYSAVVQKRNIDGSFLITWTEDDTEDVSTIQHMKLIKKSSVQVPFVAGDDVEAFYTEEQKWYPAKVVRINSDGKIAVLYYADQTEDTCNPNNIKPPTPKLMPQQLVPGRLYSGRCVDSYDFGVAIDFGAEKNGILPQANMFEGDKRESEEGDLVKAFYDDDEQWYPGFFKQRNGDGTVTIIFEDGEEEYTCTPDKVTFIRLASLEKDAPVEVFVSRILDRGQVELSLVEGKVGSSAGSSLVDLSGFSQVSSKQWLPANVESLLPYGLAVRVRPPSGGPPRHGLVHHNELTDLDPETVQALKEWDEVEVRVLSVDFENSRLALAMKP